MSTDVFKVVYRMRIPQLRGADPAHALEFFKDILGSPRNIDRFQGEIQGFTYQAGQLTSLPDNPTEFLDFLNPVHAYPPPWWGLDLILCEAKVSENIYRGLSPHMIEGSGGVDVRDLAFRLKKRGIPPRIANSGRIHAYTWYNGVEEPIEFD